MNKLNVTVFNTQPPHLYFGGVERRIIEVGKRLSSKVNTSVYSGTKKGFKRTVSTDGTNFIPCFSTDAFFPLDNWVFNNTVSRLLDYIKADVFESHTVSGYGFLRAIKKRGVVRPFVQTIHGVLADEYIQSTQSVFPTIRTRLSNFFMWRLSKGEAELARNATLIVTVSQCSSKKIAKFYDVDESKIRIVPNGVDPQKFKPIENCEKTRHRIGIDSRQCVLFVGRLVPRKGLHFLIEAAKHIVNENKNTVFVIVGEGPLKNHMVSYLKKVRLANDFVFLGDVNDEVLPTVYNCADVFVLPSVQEGQGLALLEAQATAKPVVAFNIGGINESVLDKRTGLLVKPDSYELANAISSLLSNKTLSGKMGRRGREFVCGKFSWDICAQKMLQAYCRALELAESL